MSDLKQRLIEIVSTQLGVESDEVVPDARILDDLGADSLDVVELVMSLEEAFDMTVPDEDVEALATVGEMQAYLERNGAR
jgi:acyl carrier protein